jgi:hypothetical protein
MGALVLVDEAEGVRGSANREREGEDCEEEGKEGGGVEEATEDGAEEAGTARWGGHG